MGTKAKLESSPKPKAEDEGTEDNESTIIRKRSKSSKNLSSLVSSNLKVLKAQAKPAIKRHSDRNLIDS